MKKYQFNNLPIKIEKNAYARVRESIIKKYSGTEGLRGMYEWGSVGNPGISDLDLLFVFEKQVRSLPMKKRTFYTFNKKTKYILYHPFVHMDQATFKDLQYINPFSVLKCIHGKKDQIKKISALEKKKVTIALLNDLVIRHYPRDFLAEALQKKIDVRNNLLRLNSLCYTIKTMQTLTKKKNPEWQTFTKEVQKLRKEWFEKNDFDLLVKVHAQALEISMDIIEVLVEQLKKYITVKKSTTIKYRGIKNKTVFYSNWTKKTALLRMTRTYKKTGKIVSELPVIFAAQLMEYSKYDGPISDHIKKQLKGSVQYRATHQSILKKRAGILNNQAELATTLKHSDFPAFYDYGYRNQAGVNNKALQLLDRVRY